MQDFIVNLGSSDVTEIKGEFELIVITKVCWIRVKHLLLKTTLLILLIIHVLILLLINKSLPRTEK